LNGLGCYGTSFFRVLAGSGYELYWSPSNAYVRDSTIYLSEQSSLERPGKVKGERGEGVGGERGEREEGRTVGGEGDEVALSGGRKRRLDEGEEKKVIETSGVIEGNEREALLRNQRSSGCGCQYPGEAPVSYTDTLQRYSTSPLNSTSYSPPQHFFFISYSTSPPPTLYPALS
jgi:hypothetical protein